jgi:hypothetical protein
LLHLSDLHGNGFEIIESRLNRLVLHPTSHTCWHER